MVSPGAFWTPRRVTSQPPKRSPLTPPPGGQGPRRARGPGHKGQRSRPRSGCTAASLLPGAAAHPLSREHHRIPLPGTPGSSAASRVPGLPVLPLVPADLPPRCTPSPRAPRPRGAGRCPRRAARRRSSGAGRYLASRPAEAESRSCRQDEPHAGEAADHGAVRCAVPSRAAPSGASSCRAVPCRAVPQRAPLTATPRARPPRLLAPSPGRSRPLPSPGGSPAARSSAGSGRGRAAAGRPGLQGSGGAWSEFPAVRRVGAGCPGLCTLRAWEPPGMEAANGSEQPA